MYDLNGDKVLCFDALLQVFIPNELREMVCLQEGNWGGPEDSSRKGRVKAQRLEGMGRIVRQEGGEEKADPSLRSG
jgi:hypothetical protein